MPRECTTDFAAAVAEKVIRPALFVECHLTSGPVYVWSGYGETTWNGNTWQGVGTLGEISTIEEGATVEAKGVVLTLNGVNPSLIKSTLGEFQVGLPVKIWFGLFQEDGVTLIPDPVLSFCGRMDQPVIKVGFDTATIQINCESKLLLMNNSVQRRYTNEDQQLDHPRDKGLEFVDSIQQTTIYWGRTPNSKNNS